MRTTVNHRLALAATLTLTLAAALAGCGTPANRWRAIYGTLARPDGSSYLLRPAGRARAASETFSALSLSTRSYRDLRLALRVRTVRQLRTPSANPWEVGWVLWDFTDKSHFYYVALKPNGWELGKEDPAYPGSQRFLATGERPRFAAGAWHTVTVAQEGARLIVSADGAPLVSFTDSERPYLQGSVGLYSEDAEALYGALHLGGR